MQALGGGLAVTLLAASFLLPETFRTGSTLWLSTWTASVDAEAPAVHGTMWFLGIYAAICGAQILCSLWNSLDVKRLSLRASASLHNNMVRSLLRYAMFSGFCLFGTVVLSLRCLNSLHCCFLNSSHCWLGLCVWVAHYHSMWRLLHPMFLSHISCRTNVSTPLLYLLQICCTTYHH